MKYISYKDFLRVKNKIALGEQLEEGEALLGDAIRKGKKYQIILEKILNSSEISEMQLSEYIDKISKLEEKIGFASDFLVKELPTQYINTFDRVKWQAITKISRFIELDNEAKKGCLMLCGIFGVFESDQYADKRTDDFKRILKTLTPEDLKKYSGYTMEYDPEFLEFWIENKDKLFTKVLTKIQNNWSRIRKSVEIKSLDHIVDYLDFYEQEQDSFNVYMQVNNIPQYLQKKYRVIYEQMEGRTKTSIPTASGINENGYSYEILSFNDPRILRFGNDKLIKCCQKSGGNGEKTMIYSAIESSARVIMIRDELGKYIAGSLITHQIGRDGRSYVCFDSIEVNANKAHITADEYQVTLKRIERLKQDGKLQNGTIEELQEFYNNNPPKERLITKSKIYQLIAKGAMNVNTLRKIKALIDNDPNYYYISKDDLKALEINKKILDVYRQVCEEMIEADEVKRRKQLEKGEISEEEFLHVLMKNGIFTIGKNPVSMYLGNLNRLDIKSMEQLPVLEKDRSIYRKATKIKARNVITQTSLLGIDTMAITTISYFLLSGNFSSISLGTIMLYLGSSIFCHNLLNRNKYKGVYTDAKYDQRVLKDGRDNDINDEIKTRSFLRIMKRTKNKARFQKKLLYDEVPVIANPIEFSALEPEKQNKIKLLVKSLSGKAESKTNRLEDKLVLGNLENWVAFFSKEESAFVLEDVVLPNPMRLSGNENKLTDAQVDLIKYISNLSEHENVRFNCTDNRINRYLLNITQASLKTKDKEELIDDKGGMICFEE